MVWKVFYCAGVNDLWCIDQHDKWKYRFGLCLHACVDPFSGVLKWMKIWWNNSNPVLICKYYLDVIEANRYKYKTIPSCLQTQELFRRPAYNPKQRREWKWKCSSGSDFPETMGWPRVMQYCTTSLDGREDEYSLRDSLECAPRDI